MSKELIKKREVLINRIEQYERFKKNIVGAAQDLSSHHKKGKISLTKYQEKLHSLLKGKPVQLWIQHYDSCIKEHERELSYYRKEINKQRKKELIKKTIPFFSIFVLFILVLLSIFSLSSLRDQVSFAPVKNVHTQSLDFSTEESTIFTWTPENPGTLSSVKLTGSIEESSNAKVFLVNKNTGQEFLVLDTTTLQNTNPRSPITGAVVHDSNSTGNETQNNETNITIPEALETNITINETNITDPSLRDFVSVCEDTCDLTNLDLNENSYDFRIELTGNTTLNLDSITYGILSLPPTEKPTIVPDEVIIIEEKELKEEESEAGKEIKLGKYSKIKRVSVSSQTKALNIPVTFDISDISAGEDTIGRISVYHINERRFLEKNEYRISKNGKAIEITVPHFSTQTFEIIIEITQAEHLNASRNFISDIFPNVSTLDNIWSETILENEYVRVRFEKNLTSENDITIYPRNISGNPSIEVYEKDSSTLIANFDNLIDNEYNKIFLTNLLGFQDTFDLKIVGGVVEFDHIIDPIQGFLDPTSDIDGPLGVNWANPINAYISNDLYAGARNTADHDWNTYNFVIPAGAIIDGIEARLEWHTKKTRDSFILHSQLLDSTGTPIGVEKITPSYGGVADRIDILGSSSDLWGTSLTDVDINNANFGVRITTERTGGGNGATAFLDNIDLRVTYTEISPNNPPIVTINSVDTDDIVDLNPGLTQPVNIIFDVEDPDGLLDLNEATLIITYDLDAGPEQRSLVDVVTDCSSGELGNVRTYTCTIDMEYYDSPGDWTATVSIEDQSTAIGTNINPFVVNPLLDISIINSPIDFGTITAGQQDVQTTVTIRNDGNTIIPPRDLQIVSGVLGSLTTTDTISSSQFRIGGSLTPGDVCTTDGAQLSDTLPTTIPDVSLPKGPAGSNEETLTLCFDVPVVAPTLYSADSANGGGGEWIITILFTPFITKRRRKKKKLEIDEKRVLEILNKLTVRVKEGRLRSEEDILDVLKSWTTSVKESKLTSKEEMEIPVSLFKSDLAPAEALCKYLKENCDLKFSEIAELINRDQRTVALNYKNAVRKIRKEIKIDEKTIYVTIKVFADRKFSILESLVLYFKERSLTNLEISKILGKESKNIWTISLRVREKSGV